MVWTAPRTWVAGETVTASIMNTHVRDNLLQIGNPDHQTYTPTITNVATSAKSARYMLSSKRLMMDFSLTLSAAPTGTVTMSLPFTAVTTVGTGLTAARGWVSGLRQGVGYKLGSVVLVSSTTVGFMSDGGTVGWTTGVPSAWANTDVWGGSLSVEVA